MTKPQNKTVGDKKETTTVPPARSGRASRLSPRLALTLLALAAVTWALVAFWQFRRNSVQQHLDAGIEAAQLGQGEKAEREWLAALKQDPNNQAACTLLGGYYLSTNNQQAALSVYRRLLQLKPHAPDIEAHLAGCALHTGDEVSALRYAQDAIKEDPNNVEALRIAAQLLAELQDQKQRLTYLRRLVQLQPNDPAALSQLALALSDNQLYTEAKPVLAHLLQAAPADAQAYALRGELAFNADPSPQGLAQAEADFNRALQLDPTGAFPRFNLGKLYLRKGEAGKAVFQLEEAQRLLPNKPEVYFELANAYMAAGQGKQAEAARRRFTSIRTRLDLISGLEKRCATEPQNFSVHAQAGLMELEAGDVRKASFYLSAAHTLAPADAKVNAALQQLNTHNSR